MKYHLAEAGNYIKEFIDKGYLKNLQFNILFSFAYNNQMEIYQKNGTHIIVDSGAFTFQQKGIKKLKSYMKNYTKFIENNKHYNNVHFIEMDIDNIIGYDEVKNIRNQLLEITPKIIPVWHRSLGIKEYKNMCKTFDYISFSGVNKEDLINNQEMKQFVNYAHQHNCKVHGLGVGSKKTLLTVPFDSVDNTSWLKATRFGSYNNKKLSSEYLRTNYKKVALLELLQGVKTAKYYENYWRKIKKNKIVS